MFSKKIFYYFLFSSFVILNQSFQCEEKNSTGIVELSISVDDENGNPVPNSLIGLYIDECLLDTLYTNQNGKRAYDFIKDDQLSNEFSGFLSLKIIPIKTAVDRVVLNGLKQDVSLRTQSSKPFVDIQLSDFDFDSVKIYSYDTPMNFNGHEFCENNILSALPKTLDYFKFTKNTSNNRIFEVIPNQENLIRVIGYKNDSILLNEEKRILIENQIIEYQLIL